MRARTLQLAAVTVLLACAALFGSYRPVQAQTVAGSWCTTTGSGGAFECFSSPMAACRRQHDVYAPNQQFWGYTDTGRWDGKQCQWQVSFGVVHPAGVGFSCPSGYTPLPSETCINNNEKFPLRNPPKPCDGENLGARPAMQSEGPIDFLTGSKVFRATDFATAGDTLKLERFYASIGHIIATNLMRRQPWGLSGHWRFAFQHELHLFGRFDVSQFAELETADGGSFPFGRNSSGGMDNYIFHQTDYTLEFVGTWPASMANVLTQSTQWRVRDPQDRVWLFQTFLDPVTNQYGIGHPVSVTFRGGLQWTFAYGSNNELTSVTDSFGNAIQFSWIVQDASTIGATTSPPVPLAISQATLPDGGTLSYVYETLDSTLTTLPQVDRLIRVERRDATSVLIDSTTYLYENTAFPKHVTGIADFGSTRRWTVSYNSDGRATSSSGPNSADQTAVSYQYVPWDTFNRTVTNALGKSTTYRYDRMHTAEEALLTSVSGAASAHCPASARSYSYTSNEWVASTTDEEGRVTTYQREARGLPTSITRGSGTPQAATTTITWHATLLAPTEVVQPNLTTDYTWNGSSQLTQVTQTDTTTQTVPYATNGQTRTWAFTYGTGGRLATVDGPLPGTGDTVSYAYNAQGYLQSVTSEVGLVTQVTAWNGMGQPTSVTDPNGIVTNFTYDSLGRLTSTTADPAGINAVTSIEYNVVGDITKVTRPNGAYLQYTRDDARRVTKVQDNTGASMEFDRDGLGNITARRIKDASSNIQLSQTATFDELGRLLTSVGAGSQTWTNAYDKTDNRTSVTDPRSNVHQWAFDALSRLIRDTDEESKQVNLTRNGKDEITAYQDPRALTTSYVRSGFGEVIQRTSPDTGTTVYQYSAAGKVTSITDGRGVVVNLAYDNAGRLLSKQYPAATAENVAYTWDETTGGNKGLGRLTRIDDASGSVQWVYDTLGRAVQETKTTAGTAYTIAYAYDAAGNLTQITYPSGRIVAYARDVLGRISGVTTQANATAPVVTLASNLAYEPFGPLASFTYGNGLTLTKSFTQDYLLNGLAVQDPSTLAYVVNRTHARTDNINLTGITDNADSTRSEGYAYTPANRLQTAAGIYGSLTYSYDAVGNRAQEVLGTTTSVYNYPSNSNRLSSVTQGGTTVRGFTTDGAGNVITDNRAGPTYAYRYNNRGRLDQVSLGSTVTANYTYDGLERMAVRTTQNITPAATTHYLYDRAGWLLAEASPGGATQTEYVWLDDLPLALFAGVDTGTPTLLYVHADHLNRPIKMTDVNKNLAWDAIYWPYGAVFQITGSATNNMRFPGQYYLLESGLHYNWHRHYDPTLGRYLQPDPLSWGLPGSDTPQRASPTLSTNGPETVLHPAKISASRLIALPEFTDGSSLYNYAKSDPLSKVDPSGLCASWDVSCQIAMRSAGLPPVWSEPDEPTVDAKCYAQCWAGTLPVCIPATRVSLLGGLICGVARSVICKKKCQINKCERTP